VIVAVDGPGGSGKSTVSRGLAARLGWLHLDTGAFYRAATLAALRDGTDLNDLNATLQAVAARRYRQERGRMYLDGEDVTSEIRGPAVTTVVSAVAAMPEVRRNMVREQRRWVAGHRGNAVVEGRDIGTVVFPDADLKLWLVANPAVRAQRRAAETGDNIADVEKDLARRDRADAQRKVSPQKPASDAIHLDTSNMCVEQVVERIMGMLDARRQTPDASPAGDQ
jgi:cytidylate kinase